MWKQTHQAVGSAMLQLEPGRAMGAAVQDGGRGVSRAAGMGSHSRPLGADELRDFQPS